MKPSSTTSPPLNVQSAVGGGTPEIDKMKINDGVLLTFYLSASFSGPKPHLANPHAHIKLYSPRLTTHILKAVSRSYSPSKMRIGIPRLDVYIHIATIRYILLLFTTSDQEIEYDVKKRKNELKADAGS